MFKRYFNFHPKSFLVFTILLSCVFVFLSENINAQRRDHLTAEEIEIVRDVQAIDLRMLVFIKAIERRFLVLNGTEKLDAKQLKRLEKDKDPWGELPKGSQTQMLFDIDKILDESINKLEDVADHDEKSELLPVAVHVMSDRCKLFVPRLEKFSVNNENGREIALINSAVKNCQDVIDASTKVPRPEEKQIEKRFKKID